MADLIDRRAAIALAKDICVPTGDGGVYRTRSIDPQEVRELPAVQPDHVADVGKKAETEDCISRKAAIDAVSEYATIWMSYTDDMSASEIAEEALSAARDTMIRIMREQPAVQPEIVRCKDCKWKQGSECVRFADVRPFPHDFCSRAERRTE